MFNEKTIHYFIVAALATTFSVDAFAADKKLEELASDSTTPTRASSRGFAANTDTDPIAWNAALQQHSLLEYTGVLPSKTTENTCRTTSHTCNLSGHLTAPSFNQEGELLLGDGRTFKLEAIRFDDGSFSTTLSGQRTLQPINIELDVAAQDLDEDAQRIVAWYHSKSDLNDLGTQQNDSPWTFVGHIVEETHGEAEAVQIVGRLPLSIELEQAQEEESGLQLSIQVDQSALVKQLLA